MFIPQAALYDETTYEIDLGYRLTDYFLELPAQIYEVRRGTPGQRTAVFLQLMHRLLADDGRWPEHTRVYEAEAMHLLAFTLSTEMEPDILYGDLSAPVLRLEQLAKRYAGVGRYHGLVCRTFSMVASKRDDYAAAYQAIANAHRAVAGGPSSDPEFLTGEALQQLWLQECGQLIRLVETNMLEMNLQCQQDALIHGVPPSTAQKPGVLKSMSEIAAYGVIAGAMACRKLDRLQEVRGWDLPRTPNPQKRSLAIAGWRLTAPIMYMRALLVKATLDIALDQPESDWRTRVPLIFGECATTDAPMDKPRLLDLNRVALHYSFLAEGSHPLARIHLSIPESTIKLAPHLFTTKLTTLDRIACSKDLEAAHHNANILDNLGFKTFFDVFSERGGNDGHGYALWLGEHRKSVGDRLQQDIDNAADDEVRLRRARRNTLTALKPVCGHLRAADHYRHLAVRQEAQAWAPARRT